MSKATQRAALMFEACHRAGAAQDLDRIATLTRELERLYALDEPDDERVTGVAYRLAGEGAEGMRDPRS